MISVIIPVFNAKPYLDACILSVVTQSYKNFECILIDDGSTDGSSEVCDDLAEKDKRIKVVHQKNQGVSSARNVGIKFSRGEYIAFIDSDDWVEKDYLSDMFNSMERTKADIVVSGLVQHFINGESSEFVPNESMSFKLTEDNIDIFVRLNRNFLLFGPYAKLYRRDVITGNKICFPHNLSFGEDLVFNYQYLEHVNTISCVAKSNYNYRIIGQGTLSSKLRGDQFKTDYAQWQVLFAFYKKRNLLCHLSYEYLYNRLWGIVYDGLFLFPKLKGEGMQYIKNVLSVPEIEDLRNYKQCFVCRGWIKAAILHRQYLLFYLFFMLCRR